MYGKHVGLPSAHADKRLVFVLNTTKIVPYPFNSPTTAGPHESQLVQRLFDFMLPEEAPERIIGDKAYDSDALDAELAEQGIEMIAPHRKNRKAENITQDGRPLRRYVRRWTVERTIGWIQNFRRLCIRWEKSTKLFQGFLHLACTLLLLRQVLG